MITQEAFRDLAEAIVSDALPEEAAVFKREGKHLIADLFAGKDIRTDRKQESSGFGFGAEARIVIQTLTMLWSTYNTAQQVYKTFIAKKPRFEEVITMWREDLIRDGMPPEIADKITTTFSGRYALLIGLKGK